MGMNRGAAARRTTRGKRRMPGLATNKGDASSRSESSEEPGGDPEKCRVLEKDEHGH